LKTEELLTKEDIARELAGEGQEPLSIRSVERYISLAGVAPAVKGSGRGKQARYARADVDKIVAAYTAAAEARTGGGTSLTTTRPSGVQRGLGVGELLASNREGFEALRAALDQWPVWLTRAEALERSGLPAGWFAAGARVGDLPHVGEGRGRRFHRDEVRAFAERARDGEYIASLLRRSGELRRPRPKPKPKPKKKRR
jgi:hypothetical protein